MERSADEPRKRKLPRKVSPKYLENAALFHLKRYACSAKQLKTVLLRKAQRSLRAHGGELEQAVQWIDEVVAKLMRNGLLDDSAFARMKADSLRAAGKSKRAIAMKLRLKGVEDDVVQEHVARVGEELSEEEAAHVHARKKRLGPYRAVGREERREKDMAALARAGFSYAVAKKVIGGDTAEPVD